MESKSKILVLAEHDNKKLKPSTKNTLTAALAIKGEASEISVLVSGFQCESVAKEVANLQGAIEESVKNIPLKILLVDSKDFEHGLAENMAALLSSIGKEYTHILAPASTYGKNILPRAAAILGVAQISDVIKILSPNTFLRPIYAGNALETVESLDPIKVLTIRTTAFDPIDKSTDTSSHSFEKTSNIERIDFNPEKINTNNENKKSEFIRLQESNGSSRPELTTARVVISGGRGLASAENFKKLESIADKLHAALGASRAAVDAGFVPNDYQVGQTGKVVAPDLYIAVGISGAIQHLAGMKDSKVIVAINKDPEAPIFQITDYGIVGDLFQILPEFEQALAKLR